MRKHMSDASKCKEKQKWATEKQKLDNAKRLQGIYFIDPKDEEVKGIMKNARRMFKTPMPAAMPHKTPMCQSGRDACRNFGKNTRQNTLVVSKLTNLWESEWKELLVDITKITLQEKA